MSILVECHSCECGRLVVSIIAVHSVVPIKITEVNVVTSDDRDKVDFKVPQKKWLKLSSKKGAEKCLTPAELKEIDEVCSPKNTLRSTQ